MTARLVTALLFASLVAYATTPVAVTEAPDARISLNDILGTWKGSQAALPKSDDDKTGSYGFVSYRFARTESGDALAEIDHYVDRNRTRHYTSALVTGLHFQNNAVRIDAVYEDRQGSRHTITYDLALDRENTIFKGTGRSGQGRQYVVSLPEHEPVKPH